MSKFKQLSSEKELQKLKRSLEKFLPLSAQVLNILNYKLQKRFSSNSEAEFHVFEDENNSETSTDTFENPFVVCIQRPNVHSLYGILVFAPLNLTKEEIDTFDSFIEWDKVRLFAAVDQAFFDDHLHHLFVKHGTKTKYSEGMPCESYIKDLESAMAYEEKNYDSFQVKEISTEDSAKIVKVYKFTLEHSKPEVEKSIRNLASTGVYVNSELASWAVASPVGLINMVHTDENHRRKGYSNIVMQTISKSLSQIGIFPMAECEISNESSRNLLIKSGFRFNSLTNWIWILD